MKNLSIIVPVSFHFEYELMDVVEAKSAMPANICQDVIKLAMMCRSNLSHLICMYQCYDCEYICIYIERRRADRTNEGKGKDRNTLNHTDGARPI